MYKVTTFQVTRSYPAIMTDNGSVGDKRLQPSQTSRLCVNKSLSRAANRHEVARKSHDANSNSNSKLAAHASISMFSMNQPQQQEYNHDRDHETVEVKEAQEAYPVHEATRNQEVHEARSTNETHEIHSTRPATRHTISTSSTTTRPTTSTTTHTHSSHSKQQERREIPIAEPLTLSYALNQLVSPTQALSPAELQPHLYRVEKPPCPQCQEAKEARRRRKWKRWPLSWFVCGGK